MFEWRLCHFLAEWVILAKYFTTEDLSLSICEMGKTIAPAPEGCYEDCKWLEQCMDKASTQGWPVLRSGDDTGKAVWPPSHCPQGSRPCWLLGFDSMDRNQLPIKPYELIVTPSYWVYVKITYLIFIWALASTVVSQTAQLIILSTIIQIHYGHI